MRRACKFRQREVSRLVKAAKAAGAQVDRIEVDVDGKIVVHIHGNGGDDPKQSNTADAVLEKLKHEQGK